VKQAKAKLEKEEAGSAAEMSNVEDELRQYKGETRQMAFRELSVSQRSAVALPTPSCPWLSPSSFSFHDATHRALTLFRTELLPG